MLDETGKTFAPIAITVAITGMGLVTALGLNPEEAWQSIIEGRSTARPMPAMEAPLPAGADGYQAVDLPADYFPNAPREVRYLRWSIEAGLREAGLLGESKKVVGDGSRYSIVLGTTLHGMRAGGRFYRSNDFAHLREFLAGDVLQRATAGLNIGGGAMTTCSACSSSLGSVALAMTMLRTGEADVVIAGGYDTISEYVWAGFNSLRLVAEGPLRPFTKDRRGMKLGEGYAIVVLERAETAAARGAKVLATIGGYGESADAHHLTQPHPRGEGALAAMRAALQQAGVSPNQIDLVSAHATGTPDNDAAEFTAMSQLFGEHLPTKHVAALKTHIGHTLGAAGAAEMVISAMALREDVVPPTANVPADQVEFEQLHVTGPSPLATPVRNTLNTSLGFGGANTSIVLSKPKRATANAPARVKREVWITGIGVVLPDAVGLRAFKEKLSTDSPPIWERPTPALPDDAYAHLLNARRVRRMSGYAKLMLAASTEAAGHAGLIGDAQLLGETGAILGTMHGASPFCHEYYSQIVREGLLTANPVLFAEGVPNVGAAQLSLMLGLKGACQTIIGTRTAGLDALRMAWLRVATGEANRLIVGAAEETSEVIEAAYAHCGLRRDQNAPPDPNRPGFVTSPGAVAFVVESAESARTRGAVPLARIDSAAAMSGCAPRLPRTLKRLLSQHGELRHWIGSANGTWLDAVEAHAFDRSFPNASLGGTYEKFGEAFSVSPLVGIAVVIARQKLPTMHASGRSLERVPFAASAEETDSFGVLCTDWLGSASMAGITVLNQGAR